MSLQTKTCPRCKHSFVSSKEGPVHCSQCEHTRPLWDTAYMPAAEQPTPQVQPAEPTALPTVLAHLLQLHEQLQRYYRDIGLIMINRESYRNVSLSHVQMRLESADQLFLDVRKPYFTEACVRACEELRERLEKLQAGDYDDGAWLKGTAPRWHTCLKCNTPFFGHPCRLLCKNCQQASYPENQAEKEAGA